MELSIKRISDGAPFKVDFKEVVVEKCFYINAANERIEKMKFLSTANASIIRHINGGPIEICFFSHGINLPSIVFQVPLMFYNVDEKCEGAQAHFGIQVIRPVAFSELEFGNVSLFFISIQNDKVVASIILNPKGVEDHYYRIMFYEKLNVMKYPICFRSPGHQRYEKDIPVMGLQKGCIRTIIIEKNTNGCSGYDVKPGRGFIIKVFNDDTGQPNMSDKPMDLICADSTKIVYRGYPLRAMSPFGWQSIDYSCYGFIVYLNNGIIEKCSLFMYDRDIRIDYLSDDCLIKQ